jgi:extradiol dioxygenase family protein
MCNPLDVFHLAITAPDLDDARRFYVGVLAASWPAGIRTGPP